MAPLTYKHSSQHQPSQIHLTAEAVAVQRQFNSERIAALLEDRRIRAGDEEAHRAVYQQKIDELTQRLKRTELALQRTTKDYILGAYQLQHPHQ